MSAPLQPSAKLAGSPSTILLVEDHDLMSNFLESECRKVPAVKVIGTTLGVREAARFCETQTPDIVIVDVNLPDGNGLDFAFDLRKRNPSLRIICVTAETDQATLERIKRNEVDGFYPKKGLKGGAVHEVIAKVAAGERALDHFYTQYREVVGSMGSDSPALKISDREGEVLALLASGASLAEVASLLDISENTVANHRAHIRHKFGITDSKELVAAAKASGYLKDHHFNAVSQLRRAKATASSAASETA
jgi:DNA-binding NarL/FixJ family response regulator